MTHRIGAFALVLGLAAFAALPCPAPACSLCSGMNLQNTSTFRQDVGQAKMILYGVLKDAKPNGQAGGGSVDLHIQRVLKTDAFLGDKKVLTLPRYVPADPKDPPKFLIFADVFQGKLDPYRGIPVKSEALVDYVKGAMDLDAKDRTTALLYFFRHIDHADAEVANDAYLEFAKANDGEVGQVAKRLDPARLRKLINDPQTPPARIGLFAFLLGACGNSDDAAFLKGMIEKPTTRTAGALDGALAGYIQLQSREGWDLTASVLKDDKRNLTQRLQALGAVRFYYGWKGKDIEREIYKCLGAMVPDGNVADMAIEDLRRWKLWDLTAEVLAQFAKKSHDAPIMQRCIVRYALTCPKPEAAQFLTKLKGTKEGKELIAAVEESLQFEKTK
ncbi:MAG: hypothetical protein K2R98_30330 [Gemmataceae bacterium]|nr:hypothetical protein [Gemmataceae bacterium]